jgi:hypothetical protein
MKGFLSAANSWEIVLKKLFNRGLKVADEVGVAQDPDAW